MSIRVIIKDETKDKDFIMINKAKGITEFIYDLNIFCTLNDIPIYIDRGW